MSTKFNFCKIKLNNEQEEKTGSSGKFNPTQISTDAISAIILHAAERVTTKIGQKAFLFYEILVHSKSQG